MCSSFNPLVTDDAYMRHRLFYRLKLTLSWMMYIFWTCLSEKKHQGDGAYDIIILLWHNLSQVPQKKERVWNVISHSAHGYLFFFIF
jgi:hypothetical protein